MIKQCLDKLDARQGVLIVLILGILLCAFLVGLYVFPAWDELDAVRALADAQALEHAKLERNLALGGRVNEQLLRRSRTAIQIDSDQVTLSGFLRELEGLARYPSLTVVNIKPFPVEDKESHKVYRTRLTVAGRLAEVLQFATDITTGTQVVGLESFSLRGVQGVGSVECTLSVLMIRLPAGALPVPTTDRAPRRRAEEDRR